MSDSNCRPAVAIRSTMLAAHDRRPARGGGERGEAALDHRLSRHRHQGLGLGVALAPEADPVAGHRDQVELAACSLAHRENTQGSGMCDAAGGNRDRPLLGFRDDVVDRSELAVGGDVDHAGIDVDLSKILVVLGKLEVLGGLDDPVQHLWAHIAEQQAVAVGFVFIHIDFVADPARCTWKKPRLEVGAEGFLPDLGEGAQITIRAAALAGWDNNVDITVWKIILRP